MPDETRNYLPKLQALKNIVRDPEKYGVVLSDIPDAPYFAVVKMARKIDVKVAAQLAEMPVDEFLYLNPQHNRPVIAGADEYALLLPIDKAELFAAKLQLTNQPLVSWQAYRMRNGETLQQVAAKFGLEVEGLRAVNGIGAKARVPVGHTLLVPMQGPADAAADTLSHAVFTTVPQGRTFYYQVKRGETLAGIATRYSVSPADLRRWNGLTKDSVVVGQALRITSDFAPAGGKAKRATANTPKHAAGTIPKRTTGTIPARTVDTITRSTGNAKHAVTTKPSGKTTAKPASVKKSVPVAKTGAAAGG
jgi:membrane-bound lytic murein transglycosylase D